jgi:hypothetical protein
MTFEPRTKDDPGETGRAVDQQQSIDNENALFAALLGPVASLTGPTPPGVIRQFVKKTSIADNVATEVFTITTTDEAASTDGGVYGVEVDVIAEHYGGPSGDNAVVAGKYRFARAMRSAATGQNSAVVEVGETAAAESEGGTTKGIAAVTMTVVETSEFVQSVKFTVDLDGNAVTTARIMGMVQLIYDGFTTPPVITSAE